MILPIIAVIPVDDADQRLHNSTRHERFITFEHNVRNHYHTIVAAISEQLTNLKLSRCHVCYPDASYM